MFNYAFKSHGCFVSDSYSKGPKIVRRGHVVANKKCERNPNNYVKTYLKNDPNAALLA